MSNHMKKNLWLIGAGPMAMEYAKVLETLDVTYEVIGRGEASASEFERKCIHTVQKGGLKKWIDQKEIPIPVTAIVAVGVEKLYETTKSLLNYGIENILVEKPGALQKEQLEELYKLSKEKNANVFIAYNRRFYTSVLRAQKIIKEDGGVVSFNFEFTEWSNLIAPLEKGKGVKEKWFLANSTHVVDLAFFLGGKPKEICTFTCGELSWHPSASIFSGAGVSKRGVLFNYHANWESAGRWSVEILTKENKLILRPVEKLQIQKRGTVTQEFLNIDYTFDEKYKPGLFLQTQNFLENDYNNMCSLKEQIDIIDIYNQMANYKD